MSEILNKVLRDALAARGLMVEVIDHDLINKTIAALTPAQRWQIRLRFGLTGQPPMDLEGFCHMVGDTDPASAQKIWKDGMNALAYAIWQATRPKQVRPEPTPPAEITEPREGAYLGDQAVNEDMNANLQKRMDEFDLSVRTANALGYAKIARIGELIQRTEAEVLKMKHGGRRVLKELKEILAEMGLNLGMKLVGWTPDTTVQPAPTEPAQHHTPGSKGYTW